VTEETEGRFTATHDGKVRITYIDEVTTEQLRKRVKNWADGGALRRELERAIKEAERIQEIKGIGRK